MQAMPVMAVMPKAPGKAAQAAGSGNEGAAAEGVDFSAMLIAQINGGQTLDAETGALLEAVAVEPAAAADVAVEQDLSALPGGATLTAESPLPLPGIFMPLPASIVRQSELPVQLAAASGNGLAGVRGAPDVVAGFESEHPGTSAVSLGGSGRVAEFAVNGKMLPQNWAEKNTDSPNLPVLSAEPRPMSEIQANGLPAMLAASHASVTEARSVAASPATLHSPVGTAGWGDALGQKVVWMAGQQTQVAELHLNPPHLGPMEVRLSISNDQISALFVSHQPAVREALEAAMPRLREMFADSGMTLGNATVGSDSLPQQSGHEGQPGSSRTPAFSAMGGMLSSQDRGGVISLRHDGSGMVDLFA